MASYWKKKGGQDFSLKVKHKKQSAPVPIFNSFIGLVSS